MLENEIPAEIFYASRFAIIDFSFTKNGTVNSIQVPVNLEEKYYPLILNFIKLYVPLLDQSEYS
jgi:hypothetical protein